MSGPLSSVATVGRRFASVTQVQPRKTPRAQRHVPGQSARRNLWLAQTGMTDALYFTIPEYESITGRSTRTLSHPQRLAVIPPSDAAAIPIALPWGDGSGQFTLQPAPRRLYSVGVTPVGLIRAARTGRGLCLHNLMPRRVFFGVLLLDCCRGRRCGRPFLDIINRRRG